MTYDPIDTNDDGVVDADVDNQSVSTDEVDSKIPLQDTRRQSNSQTLYGERASDVVNAVGSIQKPIVAWCFDDVPMSVYDERDIFNSSNADFGPSIGINTNNTDLADFLGWGEIDELVDTLGAYVLNHSANGDDFDTLSGDEKLDRVYDAAAEFLNNGYSPTEFVYPSNIPDQPEGPAAVREICHYAFAGGDRALVNQENPYNLPRFSTDNGVAEADIESAIDTAVANNTGLVLFGHEIITGTTGDEGALETSRGKIQNIADYARANGAEMGTVEDVIKHSSMPRMLGDGRASYRVHGAHRFDLAAGEPWVIQDENGDLLVNARHSSGDMRLFPEAGLDIELAGFSVIELADNILQLFDSGDNAFFDFRGDESKARTLNGSPIQYDPTDVRNISSPEQGDTAYHDGSGSNTEGPAHYTSGGSWVSDVDGSTIS